jgi:hypothetical protein
VKNLRDQEKLKRPSTTAAALVSRQARLANWSFAIGAFLVV